MSSESAAMARLDEALQRLETAVEHLASAGHRETIARLEAEKQALEARLGEANDGQAALEGRVRDVSGRLDGVIGELKSVLGR